MITTQENCINNSRKIIIENCNLIKDIQKLSKRMKEKNLLINECIYIKEMIYNTISINFEEKVNEKSILINNTCKLYDNITFNKQKNINKNSCWKELDYLSKKCNILSKCCLFQNNCTKNKKNIILTEEINQIQNKLFNNVKKCKSYMLIKFQKLLNDSRLDLLNNIYKINYLDKFNTTNDQLYFNIDNLQLLEKYYFVYKILKEKKLYNQKDEIFLQKSNNSQQNFEKISKNKLIFKTTPTTTHTPINTIFKYLKIGNFNQTLTVDKNITKKILLPERYNSNEIKTSLKLNENHKNQYTKNNLEHFKDKVFNDSSNLETMSKDEHIVNISKIDQISLIEKSTKYKVIQNILHLLLNGSDKLNESFVNESNLNKNKNFKNF